MRHSRGLQPAPRLYRALEAEHELGLLLPCNMIIHEHNGQSTVSVVDPAKKLGVVADNSELRAVAAEAKERLRRVVAALNETSGT